MHTGYHSKIGAAAQIPVSASTPIISFSPVVLPAPERPVPLELRVTYPASKEAGKLPIILLAHGQGRSDWLNSLEGYAPLAEFYASHGFAVMQPTHLSSSFLGLTYPKGQELFWQERHNDHVRILDQLDAIEATVPGLAGRLDRDRVAVVGHSAGGWTASTLLGTTNKDPRDGSVWDRPEPRIKTGVVIGGLGSGADMSEFGKTQLVPFYAPDFGKMSTPALIVCGDEDVSPHLTTRGADWHADPFTLAPGPKDLLELRGGKHGFGGISGFSSGEVDDESPERMGITQRMTWAYIRSQLYEGDAAWADACEAFRKLDQGKVESRK